MLPDEYETIAGEVGVQKLPSGESVALSVSERELLRHGQVLKLRVRYGATSATSKYATVLCDIQKAPIAVTTLVGKSFRNSEIRTVGISSKKRLG